MNSCVETSAGGWCGRLLVVAALCLSLGLAEAARARELTFVTWGGAYTRSQMLAFVRPYEQATSQSVEVLDYNGGLGELRSQVRALNVKWDVVDLELADAIRGCEQGLLIPIDADTLTPAADGGAPQSDFLPGSLTPCAVGTVVWSTALAYDPARTKAPVSRLEDLFDLRRFPGKRGLRRTPKGNLEWALLADGVAPQEVYAVLENPAGLKRALRVLDKIKPQIVWWREGEEAPELLAQERVVMTSAYSGRIARANELRGQPFTIVWDHQIWNIDLLGIPAENPQWEQALEFIRFATSPGRLAAQAQHIPYGPVRRSALRQVDPAVLARLPTAPQNFETAFRLDAQWWADHFDAVNRRFEAWLDRPVQVPRALPR